MTEQTLNAILGNPFVLTAWLYVPPCVLALSLYLNRRQHLAIRIISTFLLTISTLIFCFFAPIQWEWRDGLGPDSIETHGAEAIASFMEGFAPLCFTSLLPFTLGLLVCRLPWFFEKKS